MNNVKVAKELIKMAKDMVANNFRGSYTIFEAKANQVNLQINWLWYYRQSMNVQDVPSAASNLVIVAKSDLAKIKRLLDVQALDVDIMSYIDTKGVIIETSRSNIIFNFRVVIICKTHGNNPDFIDYCEDLLGKQYGFKRI